MCRGRQIRTLHRAGLGKGDQEDWNHIEMIHKRRELRDNFKLLEIRAKMIMSEEKANTRSERINTFWKEKTKSLSSM